MSAANQNLFETLTERIFAHALITSPVTAHCERLLLADFVACVTAAGADAAPTGWELDGTTGYASTLAVRAHATDQDDIHWAAGIHPGSVVWPVVLAVGSEVQADGEAARASARAGYHAMASMARLLGPTHGRSWHATSTCGAFGSATAAAMLLGLNDRQRFWACSHAIAVAGGVGQALIERSGTTAFHRAAAAAIGIQAARLAAGGLRSSAHALDGERGVRALLGAGETNTPACDQGPTLETTSVRLYPVNGFSQAAVELSAGLRQRAPSVVPTSIVVDVSATVAAATTGGTGGAWWDLRGAVAAAWSSGDPFMLEPSAASVSLRDLVRVDAGALGRTETRVTVRGGDGDVTAHLTTPPGLALADRALPELLERKWTRLLGSPDSVQRAKEAAATILSDGPNFTDLSRVLAPPAHP
jgi:hypothetical protein